MKQRIFCGLVVFSLLASLSGCIANNTLADAAISETSVNRLSRVYLRMNQEEVLQIMHAPYERESYRVGEDRYDVWFYITTVTVLGQSRMVPKNLTPLTFRNRQLVGVGYDYYHWVQRKDKSPSVPTLKEEIENKGLERELEKTLVPGGTTAPQQTQPSNSPSNKNLPTPSQPSSPPPANKPMSPQSPNSPNKIPPAPAQQKTAPTPQQTPPKTPQPSAPQNNKPISPSQTPSPPSSDLKLGPPPYKEPVNPKSQDSTPHASMSKAPEKPIEPPPPAPEKPETKNKPEWDEKDEEMNEDAMDQGFDFW